MHHSKLNKSRVLVIDDNQRIHDDFRKILAGDAGDARLNEDERLLFGDEAVTTPECADTFDVDCALQGEIGLAMVKQALAERRPYAMAFVDMRMPPGWDGITTIEHLWQADPGLDVVICTAYSDYSWRETTERLGNMAQLIILKKPFDVAEVAQLALTLTHRWYKLKQLQDRIHEMDEQLSARTLELRRAEQNSVEMFAEMSSMVQELESQKHAQSKDNT